MSIQMIEKDARLIDTFGRVHNNLRISVTDRCNLRCVYCMPEDVTFLDKGELLTFEEIARFVRVAAPLGVNKLRLTGGEPLLRKDLYRLAEMLRDIPGIDDIGLTTNGLLLAQQADALFQSGVHRINLSLDTLDPQRFEQLSRRTGLDLVLRGIECAEKAGFDRIKINAVIIRGINDMDVVPLARFGREHGLEMRYIEYMPIGAESWERKKCYFAHEIIDQLEEAFGPLLPADDYDPRNPAMEFKYSDGVGRLGMIASVSRPFCKSCNRIRLTADGKLRHCLFALEEDDVKPLLRADVVDEAALTNVIRRNVANKWEGHEINTAKFVKPSRTMHAIGG
ncbi:MAG TPA: GTP 3',8-cyclase MoaA [Gemmatales bacterium]|nr:GTP 3',8-cyclase MoaA [Gemmatales bacterium]